MTATELMADLWKTRRFPTDEEQALILAEGDYRQVQESNVLTAYTNEALRKRERALERQQRARG